MGREAKERRGQDGRERKGRGETSMEWDGTGQDGKRGKGNINRESNEEVTVGSRKLKAEGN